MSEILQCKLRIKEWEKSFSAKHGRLPSKADMKADDEIRKAYKAYNELKKAEQAGQSTKPLAKDARGGSTTANATPKDSGPTREQKSRKSQPRTTFSEHETTKNTPKDPVSKEPASEPFIDVQFTDDEDLEPVHLVHNAELGPTPSGNGKVLSIFDLILSPPESSPIKHNATRSLLPPTVLDSASTFKTPTKPKHQDLGTLTPSRGLSVSEKLRLASSPTSFEPGKATRHDVMETPQYLGRVNNKFSFSESSPLEASPSRKNIFQTPTRPPSVETFQVSPSPLKSQRFLSRKLTDLFHEQQNLVIDEEFAAQQREFEKELESEKALENETPVEENSRDMRKRRKATTQKRTTRRWKIKPRAEGDQNDTFEGKDVHEEMEKIDARDRVHLAQYIEGDESAGEVTDDEEVVVRKTPASTKINPVSHNYQRLKINDPRAKKFKQRMKRR